MREKLPSRRVAETFDFIHSYPGAGPRRFTASIGFYPDGRLAETFLHAIEGKEKLLNVDQHDAAILLSIALQHGADIEAIGRAMLRGEDGQPQGCLGRLADEIADRSRTIPESGTRVAYG